MAYYYIFIYKKALSSNTLGLGIVLVEYGGDEEINGEERTWAELHCSDYAVSSCYNGISITYYVLLLKLFQIIIK